jgi:nucleotide-binding universal stress UspA family protein
MPYKTILVHVDRSPHAAARIALAARLAVAEGGHLVGTAMTGISRLLYQESHDELARTVLAPYVDGLILAADQALARFEGIAGQAGVLSYERRLVHDDVAAGLTLQAQYADLTVLGQNDPGEASTRTYPALAADVMLSSARPVLIVPYVQRSPSFGTRILVAWNESAEAARAVGYALPLLQRAELVILAMFNAAAGTGSPCTEMALYLSRHGIKVEAANETTTLDIGESLLSLGADRGVDLFVMGGYGHTKLRELVLGGVTRTVLEAMTVPVLMAH